MGLWISGPGSQTRRYIHEAAAIGAEAVEWRRGSGRFRSAIPNGRGHAGVGKRLHSHWLVGLAGQHHVARFTGIHSLVGAEVADQAGPMVGCRPHRGLEAVGRHPSPKRACGNVSAVAPHPGSPHCERPNLRTTNVRRLVAAHSVSSYFLHHTASRYHAFFAGETRQTSP